MLNKEICKKCIEQNRYYFEEKFWDKYFIIKNCPVIKGFKKPEPPPHRCLSNPLSSQVPVWGSVSGNMMVATGNSSQVWKEMAEEEHFHTFGPVPHECAYFLEQLMFEDSKNV